MLFKNQQDLINILDAYRGKIFKDAIVPQEMLALFIDYYILAKCELTKNIYLYKFIALMIKYFRIPKIDIKSRKTLGKGTFGNTYEAINDIEAIKTIKNPISDTDANCDKLIHEEYEIEDNENIMMFANELFTIILWTTIFKYINDISGNACGIEDHFVEIYKPYIITHSNLSSAYADPFISTDSTYDDKDDVSIVLGYTMKKYQMTFNNYISKDYDPRIVIIKMIAIIEKLSALSSLGVNLIHRDLNAKNIMLNDSDIRIIDYGHALTYIRFADGNNCSHGWFFKAEYDKIVEPSYDIIFLILYMNITYPVIMDKYHLFDIFKDLIYYEANFYRIKASHISDIWIYPYIARIPDKEKITNKIITFIEKLT